jgi:hypothetical protein
LAGESAFGYDEMNKQTFFYGLRAHLPVAWPGVIVGVDLAPADAHELHLAEEMLEGAEGFMLWGTETTGESQELAEHLEERGLRLLAP